MEKPEKQRDIARDFTGERYSGSDNAIAFCDWKCGCGAEYEAGAKAGLREQFSERNL